MLYGRDGERAVVDRLLDGARAGRSGVLVIRGEAGIGKTALLDYAAERAEGMPLRRGVGIESESELAFAGLHLLFRGDLEHVASLPQPQADALRGALGLSGGSGGSDGIGADRFLVGLAVLSLLAESAGEGSLLCLVDDAHWVDRASVDALLFAARRLEAEGIALIFAVRDGERELDTSGFAEVQLTGLDDGAAAALLAERAGEVAGSVQARVLAEAGGNPLALTELPGVVTDDDPSALPVPRRIEQLYRAVISALPEPTRQLLLVAAADDSGELGLVLRAAEAVGADRDDLAAAENSRLIRLTPASVAFRHPLIRAAAYYGAPLTARWAAHRALADVSTGDAERRARHLAALATGPDDDLAAELERSAERALNHGGLGAAVAAYERAAELTAEPGVRAERLTRAAEAAERAGDLARAAALVDRAAPLADNADDPPLLARMATVRGRASLSAGHLPEAYRHLHTAVTLVRTDDPQRALRLLMEMIFLTYATGDRDAAVQTAELLDALPLPAGDPMLAIKQLLRWVVVYQQVDVDTTGLPPLPEVASAALQVDAAGLRERLFTTDASLIAGDLPQTYAAVDTLVSTIRTQGVIGLLPQALAHQAHLYVYHGRHRDAAAAATEAVRIAGDTAQHEWAVHSNSVLALLAALEGDEVRCRAYVRAGLGGDTPASQRSTSGAQWALALLDLGLGRAEPALTRLETLAAGPTRFQLRAVRSAPDLVEAAVRAGAPDRGGPALARVEQWAARTGRPWIEALLLRSRALLAPDDQAERYYTAALSTHEADRPLEPARTALLYGEWLRRMRRQADARAQLRAALDVFERLGAHPWAERARRELRAAGETVGAAPQTPDVLDQLTPQELQVVRLAATGLSNRAIGGQLFLSPRTVGYHLYKAYPKLGVSSRTELARLPLH